MAMSSQASLPPSSSSSTSQPANLNPNQVSSVSCFKSPTISHQAGNEIRIPHWALCASDPLVQPRLPG